MIAPTELERLRVSIELFPGLAPDWIPTWIRCGSVDDRWCKATRVLSGPAERDQLWTAKIPSADYPEIFTVYMLGARSVDAVELDLADRLAANALAQWVADYVRLPSAATAPHFGPQGGRVWGLFTGGAAQCFAPNLRGRWATQPPIPVPRLADIDPYGDLRALPDGARYAHRVALLECARVVATLTPVPT